MSMGRGWSTKQLKGSVEALRKSVNVYNNTLEDILNDPVLLEIFRSAIIKNFEMAYGQCWDFMYWWLNFNVSPHIVRGVSYREFYEIACENCLIEDIHTWCEFHEAVKQVLTVYEKDVATKVFQKAIEFLVYAENFCLRVKNMI